MQAIHGRDINGQTIQKTGWLQKSAAGRSFLYLTYSFSD
jgi:hypothetical protein